MSQSIFDCRVIQKMKDGPEKTGLIIAQGENKKILPVWQDFCHKVSSVTLLGGQKPV
jgi:hypothetical protein